MGTALVKYVPKKKHYSDLEKKLRKRKYRDFLLNKLDQEKLSTKVKKGVAKTSDFFEDIIDEASLPDIDRAAGRAADKAGNFAKKVGKKVGVTASKAKRAGSWVKKNKGKVALGAGAVAAGAYAAKDDKNSVKSQLDKIRAKDPSERTASEKRMLRLMEED